MGNIIVNFEDGSFLEYDRGSFDDWCVYLNRPNERRYPPKDYQYFERLKDYSLKYGSQTIYDDFIKIYEETSKSLSHNIFDLIKEISKKYGSDSNDIAIDFSIIYMGMVAEENKAYTRLGKRVKRLGVYQVLFEDLSPNEAANFSKGKKWREIDEICMTKGF